MKYPIKDAIGNDVSPGDIVAYAAMECDSPGFKLAIFLGEKDGKDAYGSKTHKIYTVVTHNGSGVPKRTGLLRHKFLLVRPKEDHLFMKFAHRIWENPDFQKELNDWKKENHD